MSRRSHVDALDIALGEVRREDEAEVARRLREDAKLRAEVERLAPVVARLERQPADTWEAPEPPPLVVGAPLRSSPPPRRRAWRDVLILRPAAALGAAAVLLAAGVAGGILVAAGGPSGTERTVALTPLDGRGEGRAVLEGDGAELVELEVRGLATDREGSFHELWLLPAEGAGDPVPVGRFRVSDAGDATVRFRLPDQPDRYRFLDVSVEQDDGDPKHSGKSVLRAPVRAS